MTTKGNVSRLGTQVLTTMDIPANEADTLGDRSGELVEVVTVLLEFTKKTCSWTFNVLQNRGSLTGMSDW